MAAEELMRVAVVGCGLIGAKRARALDGARLVAACDLDAERARRLAAAHPGCRFTTGMEEAVTAEDVDAVIVATTNDGLAATTRAALVAGKHVLVEKPAARDAGELRLRPRRSPRLREGVARRSGALGRR
jgi:predicted dehydrogenase